MKVTREEVEPEFIPVTITLEAQDEVDHLCNLVGIAYSKRPEWSFADELLNKLAPYIYIKSQG